MPRYPTDHAGLEILPFDLCLQLPAAVPVGRVSFLADGEIIVLPVNHVVDGQDGCRPSILDPDTARLDKRTANTRPPLSQESASDRRRS
jgi:hypothetical protein